MLFPSLLSTVTVMAGVGLVAGQAMTLSEVLNANNKTLSTLNSMFLFFSIPLSFTSPFLSFFDDVLIR